MSQTAKNSGAPSTDPNDPVQQLLQDLANPFIGQVQATSIYVALGLSLGFMVLIAILFSVIRPHNKDVYAPKVKHADKKHAPPPIGNGIFAWVDPVVKTKEMELVDKVGMDGAVFLRFLRMLRNMFILLTVTGCGILIPVHVLFSNNFGGHQGSAASGTSYLYALTPQTVFGPPMWSHVAFAYLSDFIVMYFLWTNYKAVVRLRRAYFESPEYQNSVHGRSLMIKDISKQYRSDQGVLKLVDSVTQVSSIPKTAISRNMKELPELIEEHEETVRKLESVLAKYLKNPDKLPLNRPQMRAGRARGKVDAIEFLTTRIQELEVRIRDVRDTIDKRNPEPYGFASYDLINDAHQVAWQARKKKAKGSKITLSPSPKDIIWKNMRLSPAARFRKRVIANTWVAVLTGIYIVPNAFVAIFLADLSKLARIWPAFANSYNNQQNKVLWGVIQAILAPSLFSLFYLYLPSIFRRISERAGDHTKTSRERHVTHKLYAFFVFNHLILFSIFSVLWGFAAALINTAKAQGDVAKELYNQVHSLPSILLSTVCTVSPFWITWLLQRNLGAAIDLAQIVNMFWQWFQRTFTAPTPRQMIELTAPPPFDYASYYNYFLYYATVGLAYSTIQPLVLPITLLYFLIDAPLKKYLLMYVFITKTESGGQFWNVLHNRMMFCLLLQNIIGALVIKGALGSWTMVISMAPLPFILLAFKIWIAKTLANQARFHTVGVRGSNTDNEAVSDTKKNIKHVSSRLLNPVMTKPLITPMVHARAQHVLAQIYHGRMDAGGDGAHDTPVGYGGIPMEDLSQKDRNIANMFEVVQENELDFEHFKNRAEFREEFGGGGELYGRPMDAMTERSATPASFMTNDAGSEDGLTRYGTPEPPMPPANNHPAFRQQQQGPYGSNPAQGYNFVGGQHIRSGSSSSQASAGVFAAPRPNFYRNPDSNDSGRRLVGSGQPMGYAPVESANATPGDEYSEHEAYGLGHWRTGGSGYNPVHGDLGDTNYESYRRGGHY